MSASPTPAAAPDTAADTAPDTDVDTGVDTDVDRAPDAAPRGAAGPGADPAPDPAGGAVPDAVPDAAPDAVPDAVPDAAANADPAPAAAPVSARLPAFSAASDGFGGSGGSGGRAASARAFLAAAGWGAAARAPLAGDASARRYERLTAPGGGTAVLMDSPPGTGDDTAAFAAIARHLAALGLSPPAILAEDHARGFLLVEDLGDALFARVLRAAPGEEPALYAAAAEVLAELHRHPAPPGLPVLDAATMPSLALPAIDWYAAAADDPEAPAAREALAATLAAALVAALAEAIDRLTPLSPGVLVLRDYHAENLIWLPARQGPARVGLLDFQLAHRGHPAYDLVSLVEDARRDVGPAGRAAAVAAYLDRTGGEAAALEAAMAVQGAQRNLRILGVFARLSWDLGKPHYVDLIPRVWGHLQRDLAHPALAEVARAAAPLPAPTPALLARLKRPRRPCPAP